MPGVAWTRQFSSHEGPYADINWELRHPTVKKQDGSMVFQQRDVEVPDFWGETATQMLAQKYFRGYVDKETGEPHEKRERSLRDVVSRVWNAFAGWAGYAIESPSAECPEVPEGWDVYPVVMFPSDGEVYVFIGDDGVTSGPCVHIKTGESRKLLSESGEPWEHQYWVTHRRPKQGVSPKHEVYFDSRESLEAWRDDMMWLMVHQYYWMNSPVQFNVGMTDWPQCHACFITKADDFFLPDGADYPDVNDGSMAAWQTKEIMIFSRGSGSGTNVSRIRSKMEFLSSGGRPTGPGSFIKGPDKWASTIKSGGTTRRAAKMLEIDADHPDVEEIYQVKAWEEAHIVKPLIASGLPADMDGEAYDHAYHQNSNISVRVNDEFMHAVDERRTWKLVSRSHHFLDHLPLAPTMLGTTGRVIGERNAYEMLKQMAEHCWGCGDPGIQFHDTMNRWNTCLNDGLIIGTNPCSEYVWFEETACNLGSHNLARYLEKVFPHGPTEPWAYRFNVERFVGATRAAFIAHDIAVSNSRYPTEEFRDRSNMYRTVGMGYCNLGGMFMHLLLPYDSEEANLITSLVSSLMTAECYRTSVGLAQKLEPFPRWEHNKDPFNSVMLQHLHAHEALPMAAYGGTGEGWNAVQQAAQDAWMEVVELTNPGNPHCIGARNSQASAVAPTGTIGLVMGADTGGIEPELALIKYKMLAGHGTLTITNPTMLTALADMGYSEEDVELFNTHVSSGGSVRTLSKGGESFWMKPEHMELFRTSLPPGGKWDDEKDDWAIEPDKEFALPWDAHIRKLAAAQPFISGAISKTINMPETATVEEHFQAWMMAWQLGLKCIALYRDGCKETQAVSTTAKADGSTIQKLEEVRDDIQEAIVTGKRRRLPVDVPSARYKFEIDKHGGFLHVGFFTDTWEVAEIFIKLSKTGSSMHGFVDAFCIMVSLALQYGVPLSTLVKKFKQTNFEPNGPVMHDAHVKRCWSIPDYIVTKIEKLQEIAQKRQGLPITITAAPEASKSVSMEAKPKPKNKERIGKTCPECGSFEVHVDGRCLICESCGYEEGTCFTS